MKIIICENTPLGFYSAVFKAYVEKIDPDIITSSKTFQTTISTTLYEAENTLQGAERVKKAITKYSQTSSEINYIEIVLKNCSPLKETVCYSYVKMMFKLKTNISGMLNNKSVIEFNNLKQKVLFERHRFTGFLRFLETENQVLYAHYEPDNDITELITPHFTNRLGNRPFIIHDIKRNKLALYNGKETKYIYSDKPLAIYLSESEKDMQALWKKYFESVNIASRPHIKQQNGYLPKRYRKHLVEFNYIDKS